MTAKNYLAQARSLDLRIRSKLRQMDDLNNLATSCTAVLSGMPHNPGTLSPSRTTDPLAGINDLEREIRSDLSELIERKKSITGIIKAVDSPELQTLLEKRYLCCLSWEKIAVDMGYELRYVHKLHNRALEKCRIPEEDMERHGKTPASSDRI